MGRLAQRRRMQQNATGSSKSQTSRSRRSERKYSEKVNAVVDLPRIPATRRRAPRPVSRRAGIFERTTRSSVQRAPPRVLRAALAPCPTPRLRECRVSLPRSGFRYVLRDGDGRRPLGAEPDDLRRRVRAQELRHPLNVLHADGRHALDPRPATVRRRERVLPRRPGRVPLHPRRQSPRREQRAGAVRPGG